MSVYSSMRISAVEKPLLSVINFIGLIAISRILTPDEIGVQVLAASVMMLAAELKNFGIGSFLIRHKNLNKALIQNTFTISMLSSFSLSILLIACSGLIGDLFKDDRVQNSVVIIAITFLFVPYVAVTTAILTKNFQFKKLAVNRVSEVFTQQTSCIVLALNGVGYLSLPIGILVGNIISLIIFLIHKPEIVSFRVNFAGIRNIIGANVTITLNAGIRRLIFVLPEILIGIFATTTNAAMYSRGTGVVNFGVSTLQSLCNPIIAPYFARENNDGNGASSAFIKVNTLQGVLLLPLLVGVALVAEEAILLLFGGQWVSAAPIASVIALAMMFKFLYGYFNEFLITIEHENLLAKIQVIELVVLGSSCVGLAIYDWQLIPYAILGTFFLSFLIKSMYLGFIDRSIVSRFHIACGINYLISILIGATILLCKVAMSELGIELEIYEILIMLIASTFVWLLCIITFNHPIKAVAKTFFKM